ncbi:CvpA family protein [Parasediminibacterium paludis]|uniref:CvpA family protein n=1 Tax=Parasediminibacterium paludis TaxID=908966 RepID=A0ABV8Q2B0_9BACT
MPIDILFIILMLSAVYKGYSRGFIVSVVSLIAIIVGLAAAVKLSAVIAIWLGKTVNIGSQWLPFLSFIVVMVAVILALRLVANILQKSVELLFMGWANKIGGILFYAIIYTLIYSVVLFYANKLGIIQESTINASKCYAVVQPIGIKVIEGIGYIIPVFKNVFIQLESFFSIVGQKAQV